MTQNGGSNEDFVVCCFERSSEISAEIDSAICNLRGEVEQAKKLIHELCVKIMEAFDAQLAAVELRRKDLHFSMNVCPNLPISYKHNASEWESFCWDLPVRAANALKREEIDSFEKLCRLDEGTLLRTPNFGRLSLAALKAELTRRGLNLVR